MSQTFPAKPRLVPVSASKPNNFVAERPQTSGATKIERYNLDQLCFRLFFGVSRNVRDIADILNNNLERKRAVLLERGLITSDFEFTTITHNDVNRFLDKCRRRLDKEIIGRERRMMDELMDIVETLKKIALNTCETMEVWYNRLQDAIGMDDLAKMIECQKMLTRERSQISAVVKQIAELTGKVKTYISVDALQSQIISIATIVEQAEGIDDDARLMLLDKISQTIQIDTSLRESA